MPRLGIGSVQALAADAAELASTRRSAGYFQAI